MGKLTTLAVAKAKKKGLYGDGDNLYLQVGDSGNRSWLFRYMIDGKAKKMGLGSLNALSLSEARDMAADCRKQVNLGIDPLNTRKENQAKARLAAAKEITFETCAKAYIDIHKDSWRNPKHIQQWTNTLTDYAYPIIGSLPVADIDVALVMKVFEQKNKAFQKGEIFWKARPETASRLRGRIEAILDWASVREYRQGENPARWRGKLEKLLPKRSKVRSIVHHSALPYDKISEFMGALADQPDVTARALELVIYTATRTSEVIGARWDEIDLKQKLWIIPANRIKAGREHRIPLSQPAVALFESRIENRTGEFVFPGRSLKKPMSNMALLALLRRMKRTDITVHGFRSSFRDWAAEQSNFPREVAEAALAHALKDKTEAAYQRGDFLEKRRQMMDAWAHYCAIPSSKDGKDGMDNSD
jgi:integrase